MEFSYYFHYCKNLKFEDRPDYTTLKSLFYDLLMSQANITSGADFILDWLSEDTPFNEVKNDDDNPTNQTFAGYFKNNKQNTFSQNEKSVITGGETPNDSQINDSNSKEF